jgi:pantetheine-phosphate adenylyltransferase
MVRALFQALSIPSITGHIDIARRALRVFDELYIAVYDRPLKNMLFTPEERLHLVKQTFEEEENIHVIGYSGLTVDVCHQIGAQVIVRGLRVFSDFEFEFRMALANHRLAPDIEVVALITSEEHTFLSSTTVREIASLSGDVQSMVPPHVARALAKRFFELGEGQQVVPTTSLRD